MVVNAVIVQSVLLRNSGTAVMFRSPYPIWSTSVSSRYINYQIKQFMVSRHFSKSIVVFVPTPETIQDYRGEKRQSSWPLFIDTYSDPGISLPGAEMMRHKYGDTVWRGDNGLYKTARQERKTRERRFGGRNVQIPNLGRKGLQYRIGYP